ncbi:ABC transporter permease [Homoserinimonas sp. A447]
MLRKRVIQSLFSLVCLVVMVFLVSRMTGDPTDLYLPLEATDEQRAEFRRIQGFDQPVLVQFVSYVAGMLRLDFGTSLYNAKPALEMVMAAYPWTLQLAALTIGIAVAVGVPLGSLAASKPGSLADRLVTMISVGGASIPDFWLALMGILVLAITFGWLPTSGNTTAAHWVMPVAVLALGPAGGLAQVVRGSMIATLSAPYIKAARGRGVPSERIVFQHALRNGALPVITVLGIQLTGVLNGAVVIETIFGFPGIGRLMITSILSRDFSVLLAAVVITAVAILILNIVIDIVYGLVDPRVRA